MINLVYLTVEKRIHVKGIKHILFNIWTLYPCFFKMNDFLGHIIIIHKFPKWLWKYRAPKKWTKTKEKENS